MLEPLGRALVSLAGLSVGDAFGERFFLPPETLSLVLSERTLPRSPWRYTDDTVMAMAIVQTLREFGRIDQYYLAQLFASNYSREPDRGYGRGAHEILSAIRRGENWRDASASAFRGTGSLGNGGGMRSAPIGAYFAEDTDAVIREARASAEVTHAHPEGIAGAIAVALAAQWRCLHADGSPETIEMLEYVSSHMPAGETRTGVDVAKQIGLGATVKLASINLGNGSNVTAADTIPFSLWCAAKCGDQFEEAMWTTVSALGDRDTTCAIVGGIVALASCGSKIPPEWIECRESLPDGFQTNS